MSPPPEQMPRQGAIVGSSAVRLWGMTSAHRLRLQLQRAGLECGDVERSPAAIKHDAVLLRADYVFDDVLVRALAASPQGTALVDAAGVVAALHAPALRVREAAAALAANAPAPGGFCVHSAAELAGPYNSALRKREPPYLLPLASTPVAAIERRMFAGAYKGVTDFVTKYVWPAPARQATKLCAIVGITPNQVTAASLLLVFAVFWLFWHGEYASGLMAAWAMTFLDTVDGKLARVTLQSSKLGDVFDHGIDLLHPPFWWWAWIAGLPAVGLGLDPAWPVLTAIVAGYVLQRLQEGLFLKLFGIEIHVWRRFDSFFRLITARRNPNLVLLTLATLAGRPDLGAVAVAVWTLVCVGVHGARIVQALFARRRGPLRSWLAP